MTNLLIMVMARTNDHDLPAEKEGGRWRLGEPVDIFPMPPVPAQGPNGSPVFHNIYVTDYPGTIQEAKAELLRPHWRDRDESKELIARRESVLDNLSSADQNRLNRERWIALTWTEFSGAIRTRELNTRTVSNGRSR